MVHCINVFKQFTFFSDYWIPPTMRAIASTFSKINIDSHYV
ncbi:Uncharacterised protein [Legionella taurinensis]|nr:Uncharacterised protein [Legionella taurinensis]